MEGPATSPSVRKQKCRPVAKVRLGIQPETHSVMEQAEPPMFFGRELALLAVLLFLAAGSRAWLIGHTEVAARDSVGFIRYALELERDPWKEVLERNLQHPGYPAVLLAVSWPVRAHGLHPGSAVEWFVPPVPRSRRCRGAGVLCPRYTRTYVR